MKLRFVALSLAFALVPTLTFASGWSAQQWSHEDTLQYRTDCPDEGEHWSYVWLVVLDGEMWVRLGSKAAGRVDCSSTKPMTTIRIGGQEYPDMELVNTPAMAERVAAAMAEKYSTDILVRYANHPYTMKLVPKGAQPAPAEPETIATEPAGAAATDPIKVAEDAASPKAADDAPTE